MYREWPSSITGVIAWTAESDGTAGRVLPDGCMDLLWIGGHLVVAGPDRTSFLTSYPPGSRYAGLRFAPGLGPSVLGIPAHAVRDERVPLDVLWAPAEVERLEEQVAAAPSAVDGLEAVVAGHARGPAEVDPALAEVVRRARRGELGRDDRAGDRVVDTPAAAAGPRRVRLRPEAAGAHPAPRRRAGPRPAGCPTRRRRRALRLRRSGAPRRRRARRWPAPRSGSSALVRGLSRRCARAGRRTGRPGCRRGRGPWRSAAPRTRPMARGGSRSRRRRGRRGRRRRRPDRRSRTASAIAGPPVGGVHDASNDWIVAWVSNISRSPPGRVTSTCGSASAPAGTSMPRRR